MYMCNVYTSRKKFWYDDFLGVMFILKPFDGSMAVVVVRLHLEKKDLHKNINDKHMVKLSKRNIDVSFSKYF